MSAFVSGTVRFTHANSPNRKAAAEILPLVLRDRELEHYEERQHSGSSGLIGLVLVRGLLRVDRCKNIVQRLQEVGPRFLVEGYLKERKFTGCAGQGRE